MERIRFIRPIKEAHVIRLEENTVRSKLQMIEESGAYPLMKDIHHSIIRSGMHAKLGIRMWTPHGGTILRLVRDVPLVQEDAEANDIRVDPLVFLDLRYNFSEAVDLKTNDPVSYQLIRVEPLRDKVRVEQGIVNTTDPYFHPFSVSMGESISRGSEFESDTTKTIWNFYHQYPART